MHKGAKPCDGTNDEMQCVEAALSSLLNEGTNDDKIHVAHERLEALEDAIESFENGLESLFRHLIKTRASLLNIISQ